MFMGETVAGIRDVRAGKIEKESFIFICFFKELEARVITIDIPIKKLPIHGPKLIF